MKVIDKKAIDKIIAMMREFFWSASISGERQKQILYTMRQLLNEEDYGSVIRSIITDCILVKKDIADEKIYEILAFLGYEVKEVEEND